MTTRNEFIRDMKAQLDKADTQLSKLEESAKAAGEEARRNLDSEIRSLREKRDALQTRLEEVKAAGDSAWEELKVGAESAWQAFSAAVDRASDRLSR